jgi:hypothetical protein
LERWTAEEGDPGIAMPHQVRSISSMRLLEKICTLQNARHQTEIENQLLEQLGIAFEAEEVDTG